MLLALPLAAEELAKAAPETALKARAQVFWEARVQEDYAAQYSVLEPKVRRQMSLTNYIQGQGPIQYLEAQIEGVRIDEAKGVLTVRTLIRVKHPLLERQSQQIVVHEEWVKRQGEWYRIHPQS
jgi:glucan-binding YG repeat protein